MARHRAARHRRAALASPRPQLLEQRKAVRAGLAAANNPLAAASRPLFFAVAPHQLCQSIQLIL